MARTDSEEIAALFDAAEERLAAERRRTADELEACGAFEAELRKLRPESTTPVEGTSPPATTVATRTGTAGQRSGLRAVRAAYESTVMSVPHYAEEYDETYAESLHETLGPDAAALLTQGTAFDARCKRVALAGAAAAQEKREALVTALETERESIADARETLRPIAEELSMFEVAPLSRQSFGTLDAHRVRFEALAEQCEAFAADRQSTLLEQRHTLRLPTDGPDIATYAYQSLEVDYPVLSVVAALAERIEETQERVERAIGYCE